MKQYVCGSPEKECFAGIKTVSGSLGKSRKVHTTRDEAFDCKVRSLVKAGYTRIGQREFAPPGDGYILLIPKRSHFGGELRSGKSEKGGSSSKRFVGGVRDRGGLCF